MHFSYADFDGKVSGAYVFKAFLLSFFFFCDCLKNFLLPLIIYNSYHYYDDIYLQVSGLALVLCPILK